nr:hypothetical protein [Tanacetum cinerariifolium]
MFGTPEPRRRRSESPRNKDSERKTMFKRLKKGVFHRLRDNEKSMSAYSNDSRRRSYPSSRRDTKSESEGSAGRYWKSKPKRQKSSIEDDLSQPCVCEETDPFTPRIRYFDFPKTRMLSHIKKYDRSEDPEDHLKIFQAAAKTERGAMPTCIPRELSQAEKCIKDPVKIHNIKQRDGESTKEFVRMYKLECRDVKGAPECMKILGFMHEITNPELIKRLNDKIPKSVDEMIRVTTSFLRGEVADSSR